MFLRGDRNLVPSNAVVGLIVVDDERYLLQLRSQKSGIFYPGHLGLFGGAVDDGESANQALVRELREELGIKFLMHAISPNSASISDSAVMAAYGGGTIRF